MIRSLRGALLLATLAAAAPGTTHGQLRPIEGVDWQLLENGSALLVRTGVGLYDGQRLSLAGTEGTLVEVGNFDALWRSGRFALELGGTVLRIFDDELTFAEPHGGASAEAGPRRRDAGAFHVGTVIRLTPVHPAGVGILRFGTRLPTTDNEVGIDRDRTDFYALLGGALSRGPLHAGAEAGLGIFGSHDLRYEQNDVLLYALSGEYRHRLLSPTVELVGHRGGFDGFAPRGTENLAELRLGAKAGGRYALRLLWVRGLTEFSPRSGLRLSVEARR